MALSGGAWVALRSPDERAAVLHAAPLAVAAAPAAAATGTPAPVAGSALAAETRRLGTESELVLRRPGSDTPRRVRIWRPAAPDSAALPVVYLLHGVPGTPDDPFAAGLTRVMEAWVGSGGRPFVVAVPDGAGDRHGDTEWADAADGSDQVESFLLRTVIPAVEGPYPRAAAQRAVAGFSMGGYGALDVSLRNPGTFAAVVSLAGYAHVDDPDGMFGGSPSVAAAHEPAKMVEAGRGMRFFLADAEGEDEPVVQGETQAFSARLRAAQLPVASEITGGAHSWEWAMTEWSHVQTWLAAGWAP